MFYTLVDERSWYDCKFKGSRRCHDDALCDGSGGTAKCASLTIAESCSKTKQDYCAGNIINN